MPIAAGGAPRSIDAPMTFWFFVWNIGVVLVADSLTVLNETLLLLIKIEPGLIPCLIFLWECHNPISQIKLCHTDSQCDISFAAIFPITKLFALGARQHFQSWDKRLSFWDRRAIKVYSGWCCSACMQETAIWKKLFSGIFTQLANGYQLSLGHSLKKFIFQSLFIKRISIRSRNIQTWHTLWLLYFDIA